jgi:RhtB (resistance to homoserine/threonine) family protein
MTYVTEFLTVALLHLLAVMSPGPDFALVSRNSLAYSRQTGVCAASGIALGILIHVTYSLVGVGLIIANSPRVYSAVKYLGAAYLIYIGFQSLRAQSPQEGNQDERPPEPSVRRDPSAVESMRTGFLTNVLNPKATLFFLSLFTQVVHTTTPTIIKVLYGVEMCIVTFLWFSFVATALSHPRVRARLSIVQHHVERVMGVVLIGLGIRVALLHAP